MSILSMMVDGRSTSGFMMALKSKAVEKKHTRDATRIPIVGVGGIVTDRTVEGGLRWVLAD